MMERQDGQKSMESLVIDPVADSCCQPRSDIMTALLSPLFLM